MADDDLSNRIRRLEEQVASLLQGAVPAGTICLWSGAAIPAGWALCDGEDGRPNLLQRFVMGGAPGSIGRQGGSRTVQLKTVNVPLPWHAHEYGDIYWSESTGSVELPEKARIGSANLPDYDNKGFEMRRLTEPAGDTGNTEPFEILPPYSTLAYIIKL